jgi:hypothetical protein
MLTKKQVKDLPVGEYSNLRLSAIYPNHGKSKGINKRLKVFPVDRHGNVTMNHKAFHHQQTMLLGRSQWKRHL